MIYSVAALIAALAVSAQAANIAVSVGAFANGTAGLVFDPSSITAAIGDIVTFTFHPKNHSVTQSTFANPCVRMPVNTTTNIGGIALGFHPAAATDATLTTVSMMVNATTPIWMYCGQTGHCEAGMVFAVNAPTTGNTFDKYLANAKAADPATGLTPSAGTAGTSGTVSGSAPAASGSTTVSGAMSLQVASVVALLVGLASAIALVA